MKDKAAIMKQIKKDLNNLAILAQQHGQCVAYFNDHILWQHPESPQDPTDTMWAVVYKMEELYDYIEMNI